MNPTTPLPLAQEAFAWVVQALRLPGHQRLSSSVKNARRGVVTPRVRKVLVREVAEILGVEPAASDRFADLTQAWNGQISAMRAPALAVGDRLLPVLRLAVPQLGVRIGAALALACANTGGDFAEWEWLCDPLDPRVFGEVLERVLAKSGLNSRGLTRVGRGGRVVDAKTLRMWKQGTRRVPGPQIVEAIVSWIRREVSRVLRARGEDRARIDELVEQAARYADARLRWARAAMNLRADLEGWTSPTVVDSWRRELRRVAVSVGTDLTNDARALPYLAGRWAEALDRDPEGALSGVAVRVLQGAGVDTRGASTGAWLRGVALRRPVDRGISVTERRALLLLAVPCPPPELLAAALPRRDRNEAMVLVTADVTERLEREWDLLALLRGFQRDTLTLQRPGSAAIEALPVTDALRDASGVVITAMGRFHGATPDEKSRLEAAWQTLISALTDISPERIDAAIAGYESEWPAAVLNPEVERFAPDELVRRLPRLKVQRARRLVAEGDVVGALACLDCPVVEFDDRGRATYAAVLEEITHRTLDDLYAGHRARSANEPLSEGVVTMIVDALRVTDALLDVAVAVRSLSQTGPLNADALVLLFPYHLRRDRLLSALGATGHEASRVQSLVAKLTALAGRGPSDGPVWAMRSLWEHLCETAPTGRTTDARVEHLGATALRDRWLRRILSEGVIPIPSGRGGRWGVTVGREGRRDVAVVGGP